MKLIPLLKVSNISAAVAFYTNVLGFSLKYPEAGLNKFSVPGPGRSGAHVNRN
jgi:catechol 2,3-dioxygenase-like lactoylglutathione lyase family enzyme